MKFLYNFLKKQEPLFHKGGKLEKLYPLFEAGQTFCFNAELRTKKGSNVRDSLDTKRYMILVVLALLPCTLFGIYNAGLQAHIAAGLSQDIFSVLLTGALKVVPIILVSYTVGGLCEVLFCIIRKHEVNEGFLVTGLLFPLTLPSTIPLWQVAVGIAFGVIVGKEVFGGSGRNFLNPALTARAFVFFTYPAYISGEVWTSLIKDKLIDGYSGATALAVAASGETSGKLTDTLIESGFTLKNLIIGTVPGSIGETSAIMVMIGAVILIATKVGSWRTMLGGILGAITMTLILNLFAGDSSLPFFSLTPIWQLSMGSCLFAIVFMATDPVSSPGIEVSKFIYGFLIGILGIIIRTANPAYPEGWMLAILLMNVFAPLIDHVVMQIRIKKRIPNAI
ncbi:NADH:ubiquinone reductase (Na(+)-transporting) subunit B [Candidatus Marinamargulisbacteria bacterium SCGC AG-410-N11]|nr:NADH:ubiquinone reductase (Na(+)-transporting) subunit B [Candidatus Marinamargulisbacteria bacterium SCGC AG-410-N11]